MLKISPLPNFSGLRAANIAILAIVVEVTGLKSELYPDSLPGK